MRFSRSMLWLTFAASITGLVVLGACSGKSSKSTAPYGNTTGGTGGTGGGTTGTTFNLGPFALGQSVEFIFPDAGTFGYHCIPHQGSGMTGTVTVDVAGADSQVVSIGPGNTLTFSPTSAHIKPAGHVRWLNVSSSTMHTVTSN
jgi:plastocyanin